MYRPEHGRTVSADDPFADHFFEDGAWAEIRPPKPQALDIERPVGWQIAHFSYKGAQQMEVPRDWDYAVVWLCLAAVLRVFVEHVPTGCVVADFRQGARDLLPPWILQDPPERVFFELGQCRSRNSD